MKKNSVSKRLRAMRLKMGLSQEKFARKIGVTTITLLRWENGHYIPSPLAMEKIERFLNEEA